MKRTLCLFLALILAVGICFSAPVTITASAAFNLESGEEIPASTHIDANCDYKCDYNCGYEYETPDFSDAKILTVNDEGVLCIDGVAVVCKDLGYTVTEQYIPTGKYKLASDISTHYNSLFFTDAGSDVEIDLNGYTWSSKKFFLYVQGSLSIYDTSAENTGKIISTDTNGGILTYNGAREINLYNGTLENIDISVYQDNCVVNLYGGKIKCDGVAILCRMEYSSIINIYDTVLETSDGVAHIDASIYNTDVAKAVINVADYTGESLTVEIDADYAGKIKILEGVENAQEAEKYTIKFHKNDSCYLDKTEYNEETGEMFAYTAKYAFTQQPSAENGYTVDFNNPDATFQWYEVEEEIFENEKWLHGGGYVEFFTVDVEAGDMITASTTSARSFDLNVYTEDYSIDESVRTTGKASVTIDSDAKVIVGIYVNIKNETTEFEIELIRTSELDEIETDKTLQNPECGKTYVCKTSVGENVYLSDVVTGHNIVVVNVQAPTCTEIGWDAYEYCTECDYTTYAEKAKLGHDIVTDKAVAPTCTKTGLTEGQHCTRCDDKTVAQEVVPALNHKGTLVQVKAKAKTCTTVGWEAYEYCTACDYTTKVEIPASHELQEEKAKAPTCEAIGYDAYEYCTECDYTTYVEKAKLGHDIVIDKAKAATCTATGLTEGSHCSRCDDKTVEQDVIPKKGHTEIKGGTPDVHTICSVCKDVLSAEHEFASKITTEPTYTKEGIKTFTCECGYSYEEVIPCLVPGEIKAEEAESNSFSATVVDINSIVTKLQLTEEEKTLIEQGADMKIVFKLSNIGATINTPEKEAIFKALTNEKIAVFLDIQLVKQIANSSANVQKLNDLIKVTVELPAELVNKDGNIKRSYSVLRYHDGDETKVTTLNAKFDEATGTLTFDTDRFSTYAIVYSDVVVSDGEGAPGTPDSGDGEVSTPEAPKEETTPGTPETPKDETTPGTPETPKDETTPDTPETPKDETTPGTPETPKDETTPNTPEVPKDDVSSDKTDDSVTNDKNDASSETGTNDKNDTSKDDVPKAGVISTTSIWLGAMALSGLGALLVSKKKKEN